LGEAGQVLAQFLVTDGQFAGEDEVAFASDDESAVLGGDGIDQPLEEAFEVIEQELVDVAGRDDGGFEQLDAIDQPLTELDLVELAGIELDQRTEIQGHGDPPGVCGRGQLVLKLPPAAVMGHCLLQAGGNGVPLTPATIHGLNQKQGAALGEAEGAGHGVGFSAITADAIDHVEWDEELIAIEVDGAVATIDGDGLAEVA
jgi:hypothetical protein